MSWTKSPGTRGSPSSPPRKARSWPTTSRTSNTAKPSAASTPAARRRSRRCAAILASACVTFVASPSASKDKPQITALSQGDSAPFAGDLYPIVDSIRFALEIEDCAERAAIDLDHAATLHRIELAKAETLAAAVADAGRRRSKLLRIQLAHARAWHRSPAFVAAASAAATVAILLTSTVLIQATAEARD